MKHVDAKIVNAKQPLFDSIDPDRVFYSYFVDTYNSEKNVTPYEEDIQDKIKVEVNEFYIKALDNYIRAGVVIPGKDSIPGLAQVKRRKWEDICNPFGK